MPSTPHIEKAAEAHSAAYKHILKYTGIFGGIQGLTLLLGIVRTKITSVLLGPEGFGLMTFFANPMQLISESTTFGISFSAVQKLAALHGEGKTQEVNHFVRLIRTWAAATALMGMLVCLLLAAPLSRWIFDCADYTMHFCLLSIGVAAMALSGGELAILKALKELQRLSVVSALASVLAVIVCVPLFYFYRSNGIVPVLVLTNLATLALQLCHSTRVKPYQLLRPSHAVLRQSLPLIWLGVAYVVAGLFGQGAELLIRKQILDIHTAANAALGAAAHDLSMAFVGYYSSGYTVTVTYASVIFAVFEADFFPRLTSAATSTSQRNLIINQQIEVGVNLMAPLLILFVSLMPAIVPLLFAPKFAIIIPMSVCASAYIFFKAFTLPVAYLPLAKGHATTYMWTELIYDIFIALLIPIAFKHWGLIGAGYAISAGGLFDLLLIHSCYHHRYQFKLSMRHIGNYIAQTVLFFGAVAAAQLLPAPWKWVAGGTLFLASVAISFHRIDRETRFIQSLRRKIGSLRSR